MCDLSCSPLHSSSSPSLTKKGVRHMKLVYFGVVASSSSCMIFLPLPHGKLVTKSKKIIRKSSLQGPKDTHTQRGISEEPEHASWVLTIWQRFLLGTLLFACHFFGGSNINNYCCFYFNDCLMSSNPTLNQNCLYALFWGLLVMKYYDYRLQVSGKPKGTVGALQGNLKHATKYITLCWEHTLFN